VVFLITYLRRLLHDNLKKKAAFIENQIIAKGMSNVTPQQLEEWTETFKIFDKSGLNALNEEQFSNALQSLGIIYSEEEFGQIYGSIKIEEAVGFSDFMSHVQKAIENKITADACLNAFHSLSLGKNFISEDELKDGGIPLSMIDYFKREMPKAAEGFDFHAFVSQTFDE
jgi:Ca2+-binding EF-hand superfamily protein